MSFSKTDLDNQAHKQRPVDIFVNSIYVYDNIIKIFFNYIIGEKTIDFASLEDNTKNRTLTNVSVRLKLSLVRLIAVCLPIP